MFVKVCHAEYHTVYCISMYHKILYDSGLYCKIMVDEEYKY